MSATETAKKQGMHTWKARSHRVGRTASSENGRTKGFNCQASVRSKYMAKRSRSYKDKEYGLWCSLKHGGMSGPITSKG